MPIKTLGDQTPRVTDSTWISEAAQVIGDVEIGAGSSVWPGAVIRGDFGSIRIGSDTHIEDNCVVHTGDTLVVGDNVIVGHGVVLHCSAIGSNCLIGSNATLLDGAEIGDECLVAAGSTLLGGTIVPTGSFVVGSPAKVRPINDEQRARLHMQARAQSGNRGYGAMAERYMNAGL